MGAPLGDHPAWGFIVCGFKGTADPKGCMRAWASPTPRMRSGTAAVHATAAAAWRVRPARARAGAAPACDSDTQWSYARSAVAGRLTACSRQAVCATSAAGVHEGWMQRERNHVAAGTPRVHERALLMAQTAMRCAQPRLAAGGGACACPAAALCRSATSAGGRSNPRRSRPRLASDIRMIAALRAPSDRCISITLCSPDSAGIFNRPLAGCRPAGSSNPPPLSACERVTRVTAHSRRAHPPWAPHQPPAAAAHTRNRGAGRCRACASSTPSAAARCRTTLCTAPRLAARSRSPRTRSWRCCFSTRHVRHGGAGSPSGRQPPAAGTAARCLIPTS